MGLLLERGRAYCEDGMEGEISENPRLVGLKEGRLGKGCGHGGGAGRERRSASLFAGAERRVG